MGQIDKQDQHPHATLDDIKNISTFENISDEEAQSLLNSLQEYCLILYQAYTYKRP